MVTNGYVFGLNVSSVVIFCRPYTNKFYKHFEAGKYSCVVCGEPLFASQTKYDSKSGWPAFYDIIDEQKVNYKHDISHRESIYDIIGSQYIHCAMGTVRSSSSAECLKCHIFRKKEVSRRFVGNGSERIYAYRSRILLLRRNY